jgi:hypothetical protein
MHICKVSFICNLCLNYICWILQVHLVSGLSFQCVVFLMFGWLSHMWVSCRMMMSVFCIPFVFMVRICTFYFFDVFEWAFVALKSVHFALITCVYWPFSWFCIILVFFNIKLMLVVLNNFVIVFVSGTIMSEGGSFWFSCQLWVICGKLEFLFWVHYLLISLFLLIFLVWFIILDPYLCE